MKLAMLKAMWPERKGFSIYRRSTKEEWIFVHFLSDAEAWIDGDWRPAPKNSWIIWRAYGEQGVRSLDTDLLHDWFHLVGDDVGAILEKYGIEAGRLYMPQNDSFITHDIWDIELEKHKKAIFSGDICMRLIEILFARLSRDLLGVAPKESPYLYQKFTELRSHIMLHYDSAPSVPEMAASLSLSTSRFHRLYKNYFGISPAKDLQNARVEHARILLLQEGISVSEVAERAGYASVYHFIRQFKAKVGMTPGEYKQKEAPHRRTAPDRNAAFGL